MFHSSVYETSFAISYYVIIKSIVINQVFELLQFPTARVQHSHFKEGEGQFIGHLFSKLQREMEVGRGECMCGGESSSFVKNKYQQLFFIIYSFTITQ